MASGTTEDLRRPHRPLFSALTYAAASYGLHFLGFELGLVFIMGSNRRPGLVQIKPRRLRPVRLIFGIVPLCLLHALPERRDNVRSSRSISRRKTAIC